MSKKSMPGCVEYTVTDEEREARRPGIVKIITELEEAHPHWPRLQIVDRANEEWHRLNPSRAAEVGNV